MVSVLRSTKYQLLFIIIIIKIYLCEFTHHEYIPVV